jgi:hypothetical protein
LAIISSYDYCAGFGAGNAPGNNCTFLNTTQSLPAGLLATTDFFVAGAYADDTVIFSQNEGQPQMMKSSTAWTALLLFGPQIAMAQNCGNNSFIELRIF